MPLHHTGVSATFTCSNDIDSSDFAELINRHLGPDLQFRGTPELPNEPLGLTARLFH